MVRKEFSSPSLHHPYKMSSSPGWVVAQRTGLRWSERAPRKRQDLRWDMKDKREDSWEKSLDKRPEYQN